MHRRSVRALGWMFGIALILVTLSSKAHAEITLLGTAQVPGDATDKSNLTDVLSEGTPHNRLGSMGSGIAYGGVNNRYLLVADRGPADGKADYHCRFQEMEIAVTPGKEPTVQATLLRTVLLGDESGQPFTGLATAFDPSAPAKSRRLDPEGIRVGRKGNVYISDEYGPFIYEFGSDGKRLRSLLVPEKLLILHPDGDPKKELAGNKRGRIPNRGLEGLAISPDGGKLFGAMQSPLIQDGSRDGTNARIIELDIATGRTREFVYSLSKPTHGLTEILAVNDHEFLVLERDHRGGTEARFKQIVRIDIAGATDVSEIANLPTTGLPATIKPVTKSPFLNLLDPRFGLAGKDFPEKVEGLTFGPDLSDGRHLLLVTSDNDFIQSAPTWIYAFAVSKADLPGYQPQQFDR